MVYRQLKHQRPESKERAKQDIACYACHENEFCSQSIPNKMKHLNEDRPGQEHNPPRTAPANNVSLVFVLK